ncbi:type 1 glutamine amidotransferase [Nocardioides sp. C4-1]|uniref:type 1 glutamine amidotransferase n=1 Tax=Nocardioides sp. C4-1 TaxID=3151851 RepID=UPI00326466C3
MTVRVLTVEHQTSCPPALLGEWLVEAGCELDVRRPYADDGLAGFAGLAGLAGVDGYDAVLVLGGTMDAFDADVPWLAPTRGLIARAAEHDVPVLGVCLGHQLAALALGGEVARNPRGRTAGLCPLGRADAFAADPLLAGVTGPAIFSNQDVVTRLPDGAVELARAATGELQAARLAPRVWGLQWHPEATGDIVATWARMHPDAEAGAGGPEALKAEVDAAREALDADGRALVEVFVREATR